MQQRQPQQPCKYGDKCHRFAEGTCRFLHENQPRNQGNQMMNPNINVNPNFRQPKNPNFQQGNFPSRDQGGFSRGNFGQGDRGMDRNQDRGQDRGMGGNIGGTGWGTQHGNYGKNFNQPQRNPNMPPRGDQFTSKFCMSYHYNQPCKFEQRGKCTRIHGFDEQGKIRRIVYSNQIPTQQPSKLGKFVSDGQTYLILRTGNSIMILTFNQQTSQLAPFKTWQFPKPELNYSYYSQKQNFIYIAAENPKTILFDILIYDMFTGALITIEQAHQLHVTDVIHFAPDLILSSSKDGTIKVWKIQGTTASLDTASSDHLFKTYSITGKTTQILFLDLSIVNGMKILSAGTNDSRVLFFLGDQMQYYPLVLSQEHAQTFKIRYSTINEIAYAFVVTWSKDGSSSAVIRVNLNDFSVSIVTTCNIKQNARNIIYLIEIIQQKLFVSTFQGTVTIYNLDPVSKVGLMLHKNVVNSIVPTEYVTKTNIKIPQVFVLQSKYNEKPGSIGVYAFKL